MSRKRIIYDPVNRFEHDGIKFTDSDIFPDYKSAMENAVKELEASLSAGIMDAEEFYSQLKLLRDTYLTNGSELWWKYTEKITEHEKEVFDKMITDEINRLKSMYSTGIISAETYYKKLTELRDNHLEEGTEEWQNMTNKIGEFYAKSVIGAMDDVKKENKNLGSSLFEQLAEQTLKTVTVKDKDGKITDSFNRLDDPDNSLLENYITGYEHLKLLGAGDEILSKYLSSDMTKATEFINALQERGSTSSAGFIENLERAKTDSYSFAENVYNVQEFSDAVRQAISELVENGYFGKSGVEINQTIYADNLSPAESSREIVAALKLQGVGL